MCRRSRFCRANLRHLLEGCRFSFYWARMKFNFFGTRTTKPQQQAMSKEQARAWQRSLRSEMRKIDRECGKMEREEKKVELEIKSLAKKKEVTSVRILAKEIVRTRKTRDRMLTAKAQMNSISMQLQQAAMTMKMGEAVAGSTQIMQAMSSLIKLPELTETMEGMAKEMENLGVIEGVMTDTLDAVDDVDIDEATDQEVNKVLEELAVDTIANVPSAAQGALPAGQKVPAGRVKLLAQQASEEAELERRLNAL
ncbi:Charged multivesicular body protein 3 [Perkinsus olseni]|uniref:Charged multivesicular body protein 3 n=1 Tax=Perkinsus olseni TaxID=32597 RepID=A0A7J6UPH8_PEROL|nr:Charged multivesicular body protein 3 [Perkinsus olseni]